MTKMFKVRSGEAPSRRAITTDLTGEASTVGGATAFIFGCGVGSSPAEVHADSLGLEGGFAAEQENASASVVLPIDLPRQRMAFFKKAELPLLLAACLVPSLALWLFQGRQMFSGAFSETSLALIVGIIISWYALGRMKDHANSRHLSYVLPVNISVFTGILAGIALLRAPYSASLFAVGATFAILGSFVSATYGRRLSFPHVIISGGRTNELTLCDRFVQAPSIDVVEAWVEAGRRDWAIVADLHAPHSDRNERLFARAALNGVPVYHYRAVVEMQSGQVKIAHLSENDLGSLIPDASYTSIKRVIDVLGALILLPVCLPLFAVIGCLIKMDSPGPAFFLQKRMGFRGLPFTMVKFRTMSDRREADVASDQLQDAMTSAQDSRITKIGSFLRKARIDELPQILNVIAGHMSFIGPRPEALSLSEWYEAELPFYSYRHIVRPGITGWAQVNQGHVTDLHDITSKLRYDFYYIKHFSLWLDLLTALKTLRVIVTGAGAK